MKDMCVIRVLGHSGILKLGTLLHTAAEDVLGFGTRTVVLCTHEGKVSNQDCPVQRLCD